MMYKPTKITLSICLLPLLLPCVGVAEIQVCKASILSVTPTSQFTNHNNGTVTDKKTGLMWKKCSEGQIWRSKGTVECTGIGIDYTWQAALTRAQTVNSNGGFAGKMDWRVPNIKELASIVETKCVDPAINLAVFPNMSSYMGVWSSSQDTASNNAAAWSITFSKGYDFSNDKTSQYQLRLVRSGQ